jgi:hypothetical protein
LGVQIRSVGEIQERIGIGLGGGKDKPKKDNGKTN